jgi:hypothetical protein
MDGAPGTRTWWLSRLLVERENLDLRSLWIRYRSPRRGGWRNYLLADSVPMPTRVVRRYL